MKKFSQLLAAILLIVSIIGGSIGLQAFAATHTLQFVQTPAIALYASESTTATSMVVTPVPVDLDGVILTMSSFGSTPTLTVDPGIQGAEEIESFTSITNNGNNTATIGGLTRDLKSQYPYTAGSTGQSHGAGATVVFSNNPQLYNRLASWENDGTVSGSWTFNTLPTLINAPFNNTDAANKAYVDQFAGAGCANANETTRGCVELATQIEMASSTVTGSTGAGVVLQARYATSSPFGAGLFIPITRNDGKLSPNFIATSSTDNYSFGGTVNIGSSTIGSVIAGTSTVTNIFNVNTGTITGPLVSVFSNGSDASSTLDGTATVSWATKSGSVYTMTRDIYMTNLTVSTGVTLQTGNFKIYGTGTLNNTGTVINPPGRANVKAGNFNTATGTLAVGTPGGSGGDTTNGCSASNVSGVAGTNVTHSLGGFGGQGGASCSTSNGLSGASSTITRYVVAPISISALSMLDGGSTGATPYQAGGGGGGGAGAIANNSGEYGGGGGAGGNILFISFYIINNAGTLSAVGGQGSNASNGAAGGGGGGGAIVLTTHIHNNTGTETVAGGAIGTGTGPAYPGATGNIFIITI